MSNQYPYGYGWALGTITITEGSAIATVEEGPVSQPFQVGMELHVSPPVDATVIPVIGPYPTTIVEVDGSTITMSNPALASGSGLYCTGCFTNLPVIYPTYYGT